MGGTLYAANIVYVDADKGWCDAVYEIDNNVGMYLTAEEHGLKLLPDRADQPGAGGVVHVGLAAVVTVETGRRFQTAATRG